VPIELVKCEVLGLRAELKLQLSMLKMFPAPRFEVSARGLATNPCFLGHPGTILMNNTWIGLSNLP
jgi:hypothetical protein